MNKSIKTILTGFLAISMLLVSAACTPAATTTKATTATTAATTAATTSKATQQTTAALSGKIVMSGSTSMEKLMTAFGEAFTVINPKVSVEVQGGGSGAGIQNAIKGVTEIGNSSRDLKAEEKPDLNEHIVAYDGIAVVVNSANSVSSLTSAQIAQIFTGAVTNWKDVGGADAPIVVVLREAGSGTRDGFESILNIAGKTVGSQEVNETGIVKSTVAGNKNAIGYTQRLKL
jgi:phosphate transport system substrate-binding protein